MQPLAFPCLVMASLAFFLGVFHLLVHAKGGRQAVHLPFAFLCLGVAAYDVFSIGLFDSTSLAQGIVWQGLQLRTAGFVSVFLIWFVAAYTGRERSRIIPVSVAWFGLLFVASLVLGPSLTLSPLSPLIKHVSILGILSVTYHEATVGVVYHVGMLSALGFSAYLLALLIGSYRKERAGKTLVIIVGLCVYFLGAVSDSLVGHGVWSFIHLSEYSFMVVILCISYVLLSDLAGLYRTLERKVEERTAEIRRLNDDLRRQAELDPLTGIYNRRFFSEYLDIELRRARNRQEHRVAPVAASNDMNFGLAMIDVDHFKRINDTWGHPAGDKTLVTIVQIIQGAIFSRDIFCRYGGEEFVILFTRTSRDGILQAIEKIRKSVDENEFRVDDGTLVHVTVSIGAVIFDEVPGLTTQQFLRIADSRLFEAKRAGRNLAVCQ